MWNQRQRFSSGLVGAIAMITVAPAWAQEAQITGVRLTPTAAGLELILETTGNPGEVFTRSFGQTLVADITRTRLSGDSFEETNPVDGIVSITVTALDANSVRVRIVGETVAPAVQILPGAELVLSVSPGGMPQAEAVSVPPPIPAASEEPLRITVTGEAAPGYQVNQATTATRTDTPLRNIPQSIQVVPRQVIEDQQPTDLQEVTRNVSGVFQANTFGTSQDSFLIRGFQQTVFLRDGFRDPTFRIRETANIERVEVLKGPASVLYGTLEPGGIINLVSEAPLEEPYYALEGSFGSQSYLQPSLDFSGPFTPSNDLYRLNALYERRDSFRDFDTDIERIFVAPTFSFPLGERTDFRLDLEYLNDRRPFDRGLVAIGEGVADLPFDRVLGEPDDFNELETYSGGYLLEHDFNDAWRLRHAFRFSTADSLSVFTRSQRLNETTGILRRAWSNNRDLTETYALQTSLEGNFTTGSIDHTLLLGVDLLRTNQDFDNRFDFTSAPPQDIFNPQYGAIRPRRDEMPDFAKFGTTTDSVGLYLQDQIALSDNLILLVGGRLDVVDERSTNDQDFAGTVSQSADQQQTEAFSPRIGLLYRPISPLALYASYSQSFTPNGATDINGNLLEPERGTQYEVGLRGELFEGRLLANLAAYSLTKRNIAVADPNLEGASRPIGEQRSRGIELDLVGQLTPGWNLIASYAYTDAEFTADGGSPLEGNRPYGVPDHAASLWTTYEIQTGGLQGLGAGLGLFFVGERQGDNRNSFQVPSYLRTDARLFYRRDRWQAGLNFKNLFNVNYIESTGNNRVRVNPGTPFAVEATVGVEF